MKRAVAFVLACIVMGSCASAQGQPAKQPPAQSAAQQKPFTGNDYLALTKKQRVATVAKMINDAGKSGIAIQKDPIYYCQALDNVYEKSPAMRNHPFADVFKTLIIMEYDWDQQGVDKDALAKKWLGDDLYRSNKARMQQTKK